VPSWHGYWTIIQLTSSADMRSHEWNSNIIFKSLGVVGVVIVGQGEVVVEVVVVVVGGVISSGDSNNSSIKGAGFFSPVANSVTASQVVQQGEVLHRSTLHLHEDGRVRG
jgi:hypothetical protein